MGKKNIINNLTFTPIKSDLYIIDPVGVMLHALYVWIGRVVDIPRADDGVPARRVQPFQHRVVLQRVDARPVKVREIVSKNSVEQIKSISLKIFGTMISCTKM